MAFRSITHRLPDGGSILTAIGFVLLVTIVGAAPSVFSSPDTPWFRALEKPWFYPPTIAFPVVWTLLFILLGIALWLVWRSDATGVASRSVLRPPDAVQRRLDAHLLRARGPAGRAGDRRRPLDARRRDDPRRSAVDRRAAALLIPYLAWVTFAAVLNFELWRLNA